MTILEAVFKGAIATVVYTLFVVILIGPMLLLGNMFGPMGYIAGLLFGVWVASSGAIYFT